MYKTTKLLKVVIIGDSNTGKTSLMKRFESNSFDNLMKTTIGVDFLEKSVTVDEETYTLQIWDTAGQEKFKSVTRPFYKGSDCCLLTFALDDKLSFENLLQWKNEFLRYANIEDEKKISFVIVGNKSDVVAKREVDKNMVRDWCKQNSMKFDLYYETSAKDDVNVDETFIAAVKGYKKLETRVKDNNKQYKEEEVKQRNTADFGETPKKDGSLCC